MKLVIKGKTKELTDLVLEIQSQQREHKHLKEEMVIPSHQFEEVVAQANHDKEEKMR